MTVVAIISSPRRDGSGDMIANRICEGVRSVGKEVRIFHLNDMVSFRQCQNCEVCKRGGRCILKDDLSPIIDAVRDAEGLIISSSIEFNEVNGLFKMFLDRFYCFLDMNASTILPKGKSLATVITAGLDSDSAERVSKNLERVFAEHFFFEPVGRIAYTNWMMPAGMPVDEDVMREAEEIGRRF
ncbi:MAG: flavodoxin family protein [Candidatus Methanomethylophilaceae archaeon]